MSEAIARSRDESTASEISQARQAAEAAFAPRHHGTQEAPLVVVKRRRSIGDSMEGPPSSKQPAANGDARKARVFRVDSGFVPQDEQNALTQAKSDAPAPLPAAKGAEARAASTVRSRRRTSHGEVTIIRPEPRNDPPQSPAEAPGPSSASGGRSGRDSQSPILDFGAVARYEAVIAQIEVLKRQAVELKKAEKASAIRWIRQAMSDYGITDRDLGL